MNRVIAIALLCVPCGAFAAGAPATDEAIRRLQQRLEPPVLVAGESSARPTLAERMAELQVPGTGVAVIRGGRIAWTRGFGTVSQGGPPVGPDTLFQAASISKPVFALGALHLVDAGKLDLDVDVNRFLQRWKLPRDAGAPDPVTLRQLLSHSAGTTVPGFTGYAAGDPVPTLLQILDGVAPANTPAVRVDVLPGSTYRYSGGGYEIAQAMVEEAARAPLPRMMQAAVLGPLRMADSTFEQPLPAKLATRVALPHRRDGTPVAGGPHIYPEMAAAGLWTTPRDLARYAIGVQQALAGRSKILSRETARAMLTPVLDGHGLGPRVGGTQRRYFMHNGGNEGYRCLLVAYEQGDGAVVMTNGDRGGELMGEVMRTIAHLYGWPDFAPPLRTKISLERQELERLTGAYRFDDGSLLLVRSNPRGQVAQFPNEAPHQVFASAPRALFAADVDIDFEFSGGDRIDGLRYRDASGARTATRLDSARATALLARAAAIDERVASQEPAADSRKTVLQLLDEFTRGQANYERMNAAMAERTRQQLVWLQPWFGGLGALRSIEFHAVEPAGGDQWDVTFDKAVVRVELHFDDTGRVAAMNYPPR